MILVDWKLRPELADPAHRRRGRSRRTERLQTLRSGPTPEKGVVNDLNDQPQAPRALWVRVRRLVHMDVTSHDEMPVSTHGPSHREVGP
jgi:hypothetical protein